MRSQIIQLIGLLLLSVYPALAQDRFAPWDRMIDSDHNKDGKISRQEFRGPERMFERLDTNRDGFITRSEAESMRNRIGQDSAAENPHPNLGPMFIARIDSDGNESISLEEWTAFFKKADENEDGLIQLEEWQAAIRRQPLKDHAPAVGSPAPQVKAREITSNREIDFAKVERPTVLVFGSHT